MDSALVRSRREKRLPVQSTGLGLPVAFSTRSQEATNVVALAYSLFSMHVAFAISPPLSFFFLVSSLSPLSVCYVWFSVTRGVGSFLAPAFLAAFPALSVKFIAAQLLFTPSNSASTEIGGGNTIWTQSGNIKTPVHSTGATGFVIYRPLLPSSLISAFIVSEIQTGN